MWLHNQILKKLGHPCSCPFLKIASYGIIIVRVASKFLLHILNDNLTPPIFEYEPNYKFPYLEFLKPHITSRLLELLPRRSRHLKFTTNASNNAFNNWLVRIKPT